MLVWAFMWATLAAEPVVPETLLLPEQANALRAIARGETPPLMAFAPDQAKALEMKAEAFLKNFEQYHLPQGMNADVWWTDYDRASARQLDGIGDSACWQGHYLAALALRHHLLRDDATRAALLKVLDTFDLLTKVSGREGYVARYVGAATEAAYREYYHRYGRGEDPDRPGLGKWAYKGDAPYDHLVWLGFSSRDTYDGTVLGLAAAWKYVDDAEVRMRVRQLVDRIGDRLVKDEYRVDDGKGHVTRPTPSWQLAWMRLMMSASPDRFNHLNRDYQALYERVVERRPSYRLRGKHEKEYFPNNLDFARLFVLAALENDPDRAKTYKDMVRDAYGQVSDHLNAHFAALYLLLTGDKDANATSTLRGMLLDLPGPPVWLRTVDSTKNEGVEMLDDTLSKHALLARERVPTDFMWQRMPTIARGGQDTPMEYPGLDMILPYWIGRVAGAFDD